MAGTHLTKTCGLVAMDAGGLDETVVIGSYNTHAFTSAESAAVMNSHIVGLAIIATHTHGVTAHALDGSKEVDRLAVGCGIDGAVTNRGSVVRYQANAFGDEDIAVIDVTGQLDT